MTPNPYGQVYLGVKGRHAVWASESLLAVYGEREVRRRLGLLPEFPVVVDLSGNRVMVRANSQAEAIEKYLNRGRP